MQRGMDGRAGQPNWGSVGAAHENGATHAHGMSGTLRAQQGRCHQLDSKDSAQSTMRAVRAHILSVV
jgi:hypothetical protein